MHLIAAVVLSAQIAAALPPDSIRTLRNHARSAEARFERLSRTLAPVSWGGSSGTDCDEIVGRFCLRFDSVSKPPTTGEAGRIIDARREAVEAVRRYFSVAPGELDAAGPLVRLLIRDGRTAEAVSSAGAFAALSPDTVWGELLLGFAHHWHGADSLAERHFAEALRRMPSDQRDDWLDLSWLLDSDERSRVERLGTAARADYSRRFWLIADPFWMTTANERWNEHVSRRIEARLLADVPIVSGMLRWGRDLDELTIRYGTPTARARVAQTGYTPIGTGISMVEYWDTAQRSFAPVRLTRGLPGPTEPGARPLLYAAAARSGYAMQAIERVLEPVHQVTPFLLSDALVLRVDAAIPANDSAAHPLTSALFTYDSAFTRRASVYGSAAVLNDSARFSLVLRDVPAGRIVYSIELLGDPRTAGRARHPLDVEIAPRGVALSGLLLTRPFAPGAAPERHDDVSLEPLAALVLSSSDTLGVYAEVYRLNENGLADITLSLEPVDGPNVLRRFGQWLGLVDAPPAPRVTWRLGPQPGTRVVALNLPLTTDRAGMHELVMEVRSAGAQPVESRRRILIRRPAAGGSQ